MGEMELKRKIYIVYTRTELTILFVWWVLVFRLDVGFCFIAQADLQLTIFLPILTGAQIIDPCQTSWLELKFCGSYFMPP